MGNQSSSKLKIEEKLLLALATGNYKDLRTLTMEERFNSLIGIIFGDLFRYFLTEEHFIIFKQKFV